MKTMIYVADDEKNIRDLISTFLEQAGYEVRAFENGDALLKEFEQEVPALVILDIMMPGTDGLSVCSHIRRASDVPIILLTARDSDADFITGFTLGCDDYFTKPFSPVKLTMRVNAMLKRIYKEEKKEGGESLEYGDIVLFPSKKEASCNGSLLKLTHTEYELLLFLLSNQERAVSRDELLNSVWGYDAEVETRATDDTIKRLRKKIKENNSKVQIQTVWGFGFKLNLQEEAK